MIELLVILTFHWFADFIVQTRKQAHLKSTSNTHLSLHVASYTSVMIVACLIIGVSPVIALVNGLLHWVIDHQTSRATSELWKRGDTRNFFIVIGLDQLIHTSLLIISLNIMY